MPHSGLYKSYTIVLFILGFVSLQSKGMQYHEPLNVEDFDDLFSEDGCIEGTLSVTETGSPMIGSFSSVQSQDSLTINDKMASNDLDEKSPMSLINELATYNTIQYNYILTEEEGPSHKKRFGITLELGDENYHGSGSSMKKAQHEAARLALNSTSYEHPPKKPKTEKTPKPSTTPVQELNAWASKNMESSVVFLFSQKSNFDHKNVHHKNMYSKAENVHEAIVKIGDREFSGEGYTTDTAKQAAASNALNVLRSEHGYCMLNDKERALFSKLFNSDSGNDSPISLVHEFASKSNLPVSFTLISEEGPSHVKNFVFKCRIADKFETIGEGSNKKAAKTEAAENMLRKLKSVLSYNSAACGTFKKTKPSGKKSKKLTKSVVKSYSEEDTELEHFIPDDLDPISKLMQIQQKNHEVEPTFRLVEEKDQHFSMEVVIGDLSFVGSGKNKKIAKRKAAEGMLEKMGYSATSGNNRFSSSERKKKQFNYDSLDSNKKTLLPGQNINSEKFVKLDETKPIKSENPSNFEERKDKPERIRNAKDSKSDPKSSDIEPKKQLSSLAEQLGFRFQFSDYPKGNNSGFVTLLSLSTNPPKVCYGTGVTTEQSQDKAALTALGALYKNQLNSISNMLRAPVEDNIHDDEDLNIINEKHVITSIVGKETE